MTGLPPWSPPAAPPAAIHLPTPPGDPVRAAFPVLATVAPVLASLALWAVTQSPFALLFALLGPVVAVASLGDSSWQGRRRRRRDFERFAAEAAEVDDAIADRHAVERASLDAEFPKILALIDGPAVEEAWHFDSAPGPIPVRVGTGDAPSPIRIEGATGRQRDERVRDRLARIEHAAGRIPESAVVVDAVGGIGFSGPDVAVTAAARACVIRLARLLDPTLWWLRMTHAGPSLDEWAWLGLLPHRVEHRRIERTTLRRVEFVMSAEGDPARMDAERSVAVSFAGAPEELPRRCRTVISLRSGSATMSAPRGSGIRVRPEFLSADQAGAAAAALRAHARRVGLVTTGRDLPPQVPLASLSNPPTTAGLACEAGITPDGGWTIDLVADGPHAVVGGVTGSGKSELLTSWLLALGTRYSPDEVNFLLVDFKGGATFGAISLLPHSVGLITDLDRVQARRALESLRAELSFRERALASVSARSIEELPADVGLARLVIVVDEFAALSNDLPELRELFADLAARGRSLGIHLILCTQRPAATLRDAILANCTLRICLRVNDPADSIALVGSPAAAALPRVPVGRALVTAGGEPPQLVQIAIASLDDAATVARTEPPRNPVRRPWCDPLPAVLDLADLEQDGSETGSIVLGMVDLPGAQRQSAAEWIPRTHGNLLVLGGFGAGKSAALAAIAAGPMATVVVPGDVEVAWDLLEELGESASDPAASGRVVLFDDIDALTARFDGEYQREFVDRLLALLRDGPSRGIFAVLSARSVPSAITRVASACDSRLLLRLPDRSEHVVAGGRGPDFDERMPPGGGYFRGERVQVGWTPERIVSDRPAPAHLEFEPGQATAVVSGAPRQFISAIGAHAASGAVRVVAIAGATEVGVAIPGATEPGAAAAGDLAVSGGSEHVVLVGDIDAWQSSWSQLPALRARARFVFHRSPVADLRAITRSRWLPPALAADPSHVWVIHPTGAVGRAVIRSA